jgi:purine-binding chemotaxis protein CheW
MIKEFVVFKLDGEYYGIDIHYVENIEKVMDITRVPFSKTYVSGVVNLRGNVIPIVDLRPRFGLEKKPHTDESRIIIVNISELKIGMIVDSSSEVLQLDENDIDDAPTIKSNHGEDFVIKIGKNNGRIIMLVDLIRILAAEDIIEEK